MSKRTRESRARDKVHDRLPARVFTGPFWWQSMGGTGTGGTPDHYYEGPEDDLWVEWKWTYAKNPHSPPEPTELQQRWLIRKHENGGQVAVIEGCPLGFRIYPGLSWQLDYVADIELAQAVAQWVLNQVYPQGELR